MSGEGPLKTGGPTRKRRPAYKGVIMQDVCNGQERTRIWPTKRGTPKSALTRQQNRDFWQANLATKYWDPRNIISVDEMRKGTPILIRDLQIMMMYNRFATFVTEDGRVIYSVATRDDVSKSLDAICPLPGAMLLRSALGWRFIAPPTGAGQVLISDGDEAASWHDTATGGEFPVGVEDEGALQGAFHRLNFTGAGIRAIDAGGGVAEVQVPGAVAGAPWSLIDHRVISSSTAAANFINLAGFSELMVQQDGVTLSFPDVTQVQLSVDNGATYYSTSGNYVSINASGQPTPFVGCQLYGGTSSSARSGAVQINGCGTAGLQKWTFSPNRSELLLFKGSTAVINALRVRCVNANNMLTGSIWLYGR